MALRIELADLWHRRTRHINFWSMNILRKVKGNGVEYNREPHKCDVCDISKSAYQSQPKHASYDVPGL